VFSHGSRATAASKARCIGVGLGPQSTSVISVCVTETSVHYCCPCQGSSGSRERAPDADPPCYHLPLCRSSSCGKGAPNWLTVMKAVSTVSSKAACHCHARIAVWFSCAACNSHALDCRYSAQPVACSVASDYQSFVASQLPEPVLVFTKSASSITKVRLPDSHLGQVCPMIEFWGLLFLYGLTSI